MSKPVDSKPKGHATVRDRILSEKKRRKFPLNENGYSFPGWEGVYVLELTPAEVEKYDEKLNPVETIPVQKRLSWYKRLSYWLAVSLVDESGAHIFNPDDPQAVLQLQQTIGLGEQQKIESRILELNSLVAKGSTDVGND